MPWSAVNGHPDCPEWAVVNDDTGEVVACHATEDDALAQVAALYANTDVDAEADLAVLAADDAEHPAHGVLAVEGVETGDRRRIERGALTWRDLPLPLNWLRDDAHGGEPGAAVTVGRIDAIERDGDVLRATAVIDSALPEGPTVLRLLRRKHLRGVSVDLDDLTGRVEDGPDGLGVEVLEAARVMGATLVAFPAFPEAFLTLDDDASPPASEPEVAPEPVAAAADVDPVVARARAFVRQMLAVAPDAPLDAPEADDPPADAPSPPDDADEDETAVPTSAVLALLAEGDRPVDGADDGQTLHVTLGYFGAAADLTDAQRAALARVAEQIAAQVPGPITARVSGWGCLGSDDASVLFVEAPEIAVARAVVEADPDLGPLLAGPDQHPHFIPHTTVAYGADPAVLADDRPDSLAYDRVAALIGGDRIEVPLVDVAAAIVAAIPADPPAAWFTQPTFTGPTPITVTDDGRVYGHIAAWGTCHRGRPGECVTPPTSPTAYSHFLLGSTRTADGSQVPTGPITLHGTHAALSLDHRAAQRHYEDTSVAVADVSVGEDEWGVWCAGALRPHVTPAHVRALRAAPPSGDWRPIGGHLDLIAIHGVNTPGFPVPRYRVTGGERVALVAGFAYPDETYDLPAEPDTPEGEAVAASMARHPASRPPRLVALDRVLALVDHPVTRRRILAASVNREA